MVIREQVILDAKDLKANVALLTANGKLSIGKIPTLPYGEINKCETFTKLPSNEIFTFKIQKMCCHVQHHF